MTFPLNVFCPELWKIDETVVYTMQTCKIQHAGFETCMHEHNLQLVFLSIRFSASLSTSTVNDVGETVAVCTHPVREKVIVEQRYKMLYNYIMIMICMYVYDTIHNMIICITVLLYYQPNVADFLAMCASKTTMYEGSAGIY